MLRAVDDVGSVELLGVHWPRRYLRTRGAGFDTSCAEDSLGILLRIGNTFELGFRGLSRHYR